ncbi:MAG: hypothetical protein H7X88_05620, partial [Gloeobacteraceae cyanobacterium ES-bin-316]|nr:hypothetical protein [Ferruginibacter sp.]
IKNRLQRITQAGKLSIVYSTDAEEKEYLEYIAQLQSENILAKEIEQHEVEELKGISGLKLLRAKIIY